MPVGSIGAAAFLIDNYGTDSGEGSENRTGTSHNAGNTSFAGGDPGILELFPSSGWPEESRLLHRGWKEGKKRGSQRLFRKKSNEGIAFLQQFHDFFPPGERFAFIKEILFVLTGSLLILPVEGIKINKGPGKERMDEVQKLSGLPPSRKGTFFLSI
jgi:hypothetical protein